MWLKRIAVVAGIAIFSDITFALVKNIMSRYCDRFSLFSFGEKDFCSVQRCEDLTCKVHNLEKLAKLLRSAKHSVDVCMYMLTCKSLCGTLLEIHRKGVKVRLILDVSHGLHSRIQNLKRAGITVGWFQSSDSSLMHHKFCVIDGKPKESNTINKFLDMIFPPIKESKAITGSLNWTQGGLSTNFEHMLVTNDPAIVSQYQHLFDDIAAEFGI